MILSIPQQIATHYIALVSRFIARPGDPSQLQVEKGLLVGGTFFVLPAALMWGAAYLYFGELPAAAVTFAYLLFSLVGLWHLRRTGERRPLALIELLCTLFLPFILTLLLGGFAQSSAIILAAIMSPLGTLLYYPQSHSDRWFAAYIGLLILAAVLDGFVRRENGLPTWLIITFFMLNVAALSSIVYLMIRAYIQQRNIATDMLRLEQEKSERLLLNVLPASIAEILKEEGRTIANRYDAVSILFADVVDSTPLSEQLDAADVVELLNEAFTYFDTIVKKYGLEKIRTMGDSYMVASGVPSPRSDHAQALADAALEMRHYQQHIFSPHAGHLRFRFGMNCGPVVAGVIGNTKFHYDVWGDPVNVASRMESQGQVDKIHISEHMYEMLKDEFLCEPRGTIEIKGKGRMQTWFLIDRCPPES